MPGKTTVNSAKDPIIATEETAHTKYVGVNPAEIAFTKEWYERVQREATHHMEEEIKGVATIATREEHA